MSLAYALPFFCDVMLYLGALGCFGILGVCADSLAFAPLPLLAGCWLSGRLIGRGQWWLRWLPMVSAIPCFLLGGNVGGRLATLPMIVYLGLYILNNRRAPDYDYAADRFRHSLIVAGVVLLVAVLIGATGWKRGLPFLFAYFTLNVALLRLLRHDDAVARSPRFRLMNLGGVALVCAVGFGLSQPGIVAALRAAWQWVLDNVIMNLVALALYGIEWLLYLVGRVIAFLGIRGDMDLGSVVQQPPQGPGPGALAAAEQVRAWPPFVRFMLQALGALALAALVFVVLRALAQQTARFETHTGADTRESLDAETPKAPARRSLRRRSEDGVRHWYRRMLLLARARGGRVAPTMNTQQLLEQNAPPLDPEAMRELREIYLPVRYGEREATKEDVRRARVAYERLKKSPT